MNARSTVDYLYGLYRDRGEEHYGEAVTQLAHALHCAELAKTKKQHESIILAAFFHDLGHLIETSTANGIYGNPEHDQLGADKLSRLGLDLSITEPIKLHVKAKRYLCYKHPDYKDRLSFASQKTLELQGGSMGVEEAKSFESNPYSHDAVTLRLIDDEGKARSARLEDASWVFSLLEGYLRVK